MGRWGFLDTGVKLHGALTLLHCRKGVLTERRFLSREGSLRRDIISLLSIDTVVSARLCAVLLLC